MFDQMGWCPMTIFQVAFDRSRDASSSASWQPVHCCSSPPVAMRRAHVCSAQKTMSVANACASVHYALGVDPNTIPFARAHDALT